METINEISKLVILLIRVGAVLRISMLFLSSAWNTDEFEANKKRIKNVVVLEVIAECVFLLKDLILSYY